MPFSLIPDRVYQSVYDIDPAALRQAGITLLLADLDNTLAKYGQPEPDQALRDWKRALEAAVVEPIELAGNPGRYIRYAVEEPFRALGRRNNRRAL